MEKVKVELVKEIQAHGETVKELLLREPNGGDIRKVGFPYTMEASGAMSFNASTGAKYIEVLAGIPPSSVDQLCPADFQSCMTEIMGFFGSTPRT